MKNYLIAIFLLTLSGSVAGQSEIDLKNPPAEAALFADGFISTRDERTRLCHFTGWYRNLLHDIHPSIHISDHCL